MLGAFLTWLAEQRARVFIVATANDITALPPELVRKGRFDEIFFVDLPSPAARLEIFGIHCKKRAVVLSEPDMKALAARSEGFSGAEIEQAVVSALYTAHANKQVVDAQAHRRRARRDPAAVRGDGREDRRAARTGPPSAPSPPINGDTPHFLAKWGRTSLSARVRAPAPRAAQPAPRTAAALLPTRATQSRTSPRPSPRRQMPRRLPVMITAAIAPARNNAVNATLMRPAITRSRANRTRRVVSAQVASATHECR